MNAFRALSYRNYRLFFIGQGISLVGTWMQMIALAWLIYRLTNSPFLLGMAAFLSQILVFLFAPFAGVIADRVNQKKILLLTQVLSMIQAFLLALLVFTNTASVWNILLLCLLLGFINAFDMPVRQSFVAEMVEKKEVLGNAIALNSSLVNLARLIGPIIAGIIIAAFGEGFCFFLNGVSYIAAIISLIAMKILPKKKKPESKVFKDLKEGFSYAFNFSPIRNILALLGLISLFGMSYTILLPVMARDILHGGPQTLGILMAASGIGALFGALYLASRKSVLGLGNLIVDSSILFGLGLIGVSFSNTLWLSCLLISFVGFGMMVQMASSNTILQTIVDEDKRGRVMSLFTMSFVGMAPFGSLLAGSLANRFGVPITLLFSGFTCLLGASIFAYNLPNLRKNVRPIYIKMGILPEVKTAIQVVSDLTGASEKE